VALNPHIRTGLRVFGIAAAAAGLNSSAAETDRFSPQPHIDDYNAANVFVAKNPPLTFANTHDSTFSDSFRTLCRTYLSSDEGKAALEVQTAEVEAGFSDELVTNQRIDVETVEQIILLNSCGQFLDSRLPLLQSSFSTAYDQREKLTHFTTYNWEDTEGNIHRWVALHPEDDLPWTRDEFKTFMEVSEQFDKMKGGGHAYFAPSELAYLIHADFPIFDGVSDGGIWPVTTVNKSNTDVAISITSSTMDSDVGGEEAIEEWGLSDSSVVEGCQGAFANWLSKMTIDIKKRFPAEARQFSLHQEDICNAIAEAVAAIKLDMNYEEYRDSDIWGIGSVPAGEVIRSPINRELWDMLHEGFAPVSIEDSNTFSDEEEGNSSGGVFGIEDQGYRVPSLQGASNILLARVVDEMHTLKSFQKGYLRSHVGGRIKTLANLGEVLAEVDHGVYGQDGNVLDL